MLVGALPDETEVEIEIAAVGAKDATTWLVTSTAAGAEKLWTVPKGGAKRFVAVFAELGNVKATDPAMGDTVVAASVYNMMLVPVTTPFVELLSAGGEFKAAENPRET